MLGDSVVAVKHCMDPRSGKVSNRTWTMAALSAASLVAAIVAFAVSVHTAAANKAGLEYWTHTLHKPAFSFRPEVLSGAFDVLMFGGMSLGISLAIMSLLRMRDEKKSPYYRIGNAPGVELALEQAPTPSFPLVAPRGDDFVFNYAPGLEGELVLDGRTTPLAELAASGQARPSPEVIGAFELPIPDRARIKVRAGLATMIVSSVERPRRHAVPVAMLESRTMKYFAGSLAAHLGIWLALQWVPAEDGSASVDLAMEEGQNVRLISTEHEDKVEVAVNDSGDGGKAQDNGDTKAPMNEGQAGTNTAGTDPQRIHIKDRGAEPQLTRAAAIQEAREAGILGPLASLQSGIQSVAAETDFASGFDTYDQKGGVFDGSSEGGMGFGLGRNGFGAGGGCTKAPCGIGVGDYHTLGAGSRIGRGYGIPGGVGPGSHGHKSHAPEPTIGQATIGGDYDKAIIRRYIKQNIDKIGFCYEHELLAHPDLAGEVVVQFFIQPNGTVKGSTGKGFDANVSNCVADVVGRIEFPAPSGGGITVNYPFNFHPAGK